MDAKEGLDTGATMSRQDFRTGVVVGFFGWLLLAYIDNGLFYISRIIVKLATYLGII